MPAEERDHRDEVIELLDDLAECCRDGEYGFRECAGQVCSDSLRSTFLQRADDYRRDARVLADLIRQRGGTVEENVGALEAMHRGWVPIKSKLGTYDDPAVLEEAERGEDNARARYLEALQKNPPPAVRAVLELHMQGVQRSHDKVKRLRDQYPT